jgi:hypothetical protein
MPGYRKVTTKRRYIALVLFSLILFTGVITTLNTAYAAAETASGAIGIQGTIPSAPPSRGATITVPSNGQIFTSEPITVSGICPSNLLIKIFDNGVFVGSVICANGSYSLQISLFGSLNSLTAIDYDSLDQAGPTSNPVNVNFNNTSFSQLGNYISLSSVYAERGASPGSQLTWPILLSGGSSPYAVSVDWGDGTPLELISRTFTGTVNISHIYKSAGVYTVIVKATDKNGEEAFLQLVGQATGAIQHNNQSLGSNQIIIKQVAWWPSLFIVPMSFVAFKLGSKHEKERH